MGRILELPPPRMQDPGAPREVSADAALVVGQPLESRGRRPNHRLVRGALMGAEEGSQRRRHGEGHQEVRPGQLFIQVVLTPLLGCMLRTLGTVAVATGMVHAVLSPTVGALREAVSVRAALALVDGAHDCAVGEGQMGVALQVLLAHRQ